MQTLREQHYLQRRERMVRRWPLIGAVLLGLLLALAGGLAWWSPLLINPWAVIARLEGQGLPEATLLMMAAILPIVTLTLLVVVFAGVLFAWLAMANERRLLGIVRRLQSLGHARDLGQTHAGSAPTNTPPAQGLPGNSGPG